MMQSQYSNRIESGKTVKSQKQQDWRAYIKNGLQYVIVYFARTTFVSARTIIVTVEAISNNNNKKRKENNVCALRGMRPLKKAGLQPERRNKY